MAVPFDDFISYIWVIQFLNRESYASLWCCHSSSHSDRCVLKSHCGLSLYFCKGWWCWTSSHVLTSICMYILFKWAFTEQNFKFWWGPIYQFLFLWLLLLVSILRILSSSRFQRISPLYFFPNSFRVSGFIFMPVVYFEFIFIHSIRFKSRFI